jgi:hypothetical protein
MELVVLPVILAAGGWVVTRLPGPARDALQATVHAKDVQLLLGAMERRALAVAPLGSPVSGAAADVAQYARDAVPEVVAKLGVSPNAMQTMAAAALVRAAAEAAQAAKGPPRN